MKTFVTVPLLINFSLLGGLFSFIAMELRLFIYLIILNHSVCRISTASWPARQIRRPGFPSCYISQHVLHTILMRSVMWIDTCI